MRLVRGKAVGLPPLTDAEFVFFNKTLFQNAGLATPAELKQRKNWDWQHFSQAAARLTKRSSSAGVEQVANVYGFEFPGWLRWLLPYLATWGAGVLSSDLSKPALQTPEMAAAVDALVTLTAKNQTAFPPGIPKAPPYLTMEKDGRIGMAQAWDARAAFWRKVQFDWDVVGSVPAATHGPQSIVDGTPMVLFAESPHKDAAWELTRWLLTPGPNLDFCISFGSAPALRSNLAPFKVALAKQGKPLNLNAYDEALSIGHHIPPTAAYLDLENAWDKGTIPLWLGKADAQSVLATLTTQFTTILAKYQ